MQFSQDPDAGGPLHSQGARIGYPPKMVTVMGTIPRWNAIPLALLVVVGSACARTASTGTDQVQPVAVSKGAAASTVTAEDVERSPNVPIEQLLAGKVSGVIVTRTADGGIAVRVRGGSSSFSGNNAPLYVLDGVAIEAGPNGGLPGVNPYDIASIKVLKDAADITMYGVRGANGVIVIKTKRPNQ